MCSNLLQTTTILLPHSPRQNCPRWFTWEVQFTPRSNRAKVSQFALYVSLSLCPCTILSSTNRLCYADDDCLTFFVWFCSVLFKFECPNQLRFFYNFFFFNEICFNCFILFKFERVKFTLLRYKSFTYRIKWTTYNVKRANFHSFDVNFTLSYLERSILWNSCKRSCWFYLKGSLNLRVFK